MAIWNTNAFSKKQTGTVKKSDTKRLMRCENNILTNRDRKVCS